MAVCFEYFHRDEANFKTNAERWFEGDLTPELENRLKSAMKDESWGECAVFVAEDVYLDSRGPGFHEFWGLTARERIPLHEPKDERTFEEFVQDMEKASAQGWNPEQDYRLNKKDAEFVAYILNCYKLDNFIHQDRKTPQGLNDLINMFSR